ncbi:MAG: AMP-binding protein [Candidatus Omnitrophota bacterium]
MDIALKLRKQSELTPDKTAIIFRDEIITFDTFTSMVNGLSNGLRKRGIEKGDKVAVYLPNTPEYAIAYFAVFSLGACVVPLDVNLTTEEVKCILKHSETKLVISKSLKNLSFGDLKKETPSLKDIIVFDADNETDGFSSFDKVLNENKNDFSQTLINDNDLAVLFYTSGTTGKPKAVMLNYKNLENACRTMAHIGVEKHFGDIQICALPLSHIGGMIYLQITVEYGAGIILMERFIPVEFLKNIEKHKANWFHIVPAMFTALLHLKEFEKYDLTSVTGVNIFGAPSHPSLIQRFGQYCPNSTLWHGWGMTETSAPNTAVSNENLKSVGKTPPWFEVKIFDNNDNELPIGETGEIVCRGWPVMMGYYKEPEMTAEIMRGGWLHTGDLGTIDKEGFIYIRGRKKDMIITGGLNVYSPEVENVLMEHPKVKEAAIIGIPDELRGEIVKAVVVLKEGEQADGNEIKAFCRQKLIHFKVPVIVEFSDTLPKTRTGKVQKELLKK